MLIVSIIVAAVTVIFIIGQPHPHGAAYVNRTMLMIILYCIIYAVAVHVLGAPAFKEWC